MAVLAADSVAVTEDFPVVAVDSAAAVRAEAGSFAMRGI